MQPAKPALASSHWNDVAHLGYRLWRPQASTQCRPRTHKTHIACQLQVTPSGVEALRETSGRWVPRHGPAGRPAAKRFCLRTCLSQGWPKGFRLQHRGLSRPRARGPGLSAPGRRWVPKHGPARRPAAKRFCLRTCLSQGWPKGFRLQHRGLSRPRARGPGLSAPGRRWVPKHGPARRPAAKRFCLRTCLSQGWPKGFRLQHRGLSRPRARGPGLSAPGRRWVPKHGPAGRPAAKRFCLRTCLSQGWPKGFRL